MTQSFPAYQVTCADLDRIKAVAARIFDRTVSPQSRLEIISRSAGFGSYAALRAALKEGPVRLSGNQDLEEVFIAKAGLDAAPIAFVDGISHNDLLTAGLAWSERLAVRPAMTMSSEKKLGLFKASSGTRQDFLDFLYALREDGIPPRSLYRSSLTPDQAARIHPDISLVVASPANQRALTWDFENEAPRLTAGGKWVGARVKLTQNDRFFEEPETHHCLDDLSPDELAQLITHARVVCFDEEDRQGFLDFLVQAGLETSDVPVISIKDEALDIEHEEEGDFFSVGYYGTARMDLPDVPLDEHGPLLRSLAFGWICEILNVVHGCAYEFLRLTLGTGPGYERPWDSDLLIQA